MKLRIGREFTPAEFRVLVALLLLQAADWVTTEMLQARESTIEGNPLAGWFLEHELLWLPKFSLPLLAALIVARTKQLSHNFLRFLQFVVIVYVGVVGWNVLQLVLL